MVHWVWGAQVKSMGWVGCAERGWGVVMTCNGWVWN